MELWKDIIDYPGYQASNLGRIRSHNKVTRSARSNERHWADRIIQQKVGKDKCCRVDLWKDGKHKTLLVHRIVADTFIDRKMHTSLTVNHKDGNRLNNSIENLEWLSVGDNIRHGFENGLYSCQTHCTLTDNLGEATHYRSLSEASQAIGRNKGYISNCVKKGKFAKGQDGSVYAIRIGA